MEPQAKGFIWGLIVGAAIIFIGTLGASNDHWRTQIVEHDCGQYNPKTRAFEWVVKETP